MALLISDTNIFIDFEDGGLLQALFRLPESVGVPDLLFDDELRDEHAHLLDHGLVLVELSAAPDGLREDEGERATAAVGGGGASASATRELRLTTTRGSPAPADRATQVVDGEHEAVGAEVVVGAAGDAEDGGGGVQREAGAGQHVVEGEAGGAGVAIGEGVEEADVEVGAGGARGRGRVGAVGLLEAGGEAALGVGLGRRLRRGGPPSV